MENLTKYQWVYIQVSKCVAVNVVALTRSWMHHFLTLKIILWCHRRHNSFLSIDFPACGKETDVSVSSYMHWVLWALHIRYLNSCTVSLLLICTELNNTGGPQLPKAMTTAQIWRCELIPERRYGPSATHAGGEITSFKRRWFSK